LAQARQGNRKNKLLLIVFKQPHPHKGFAMTRTEHIEAFHNLGEYLRNLDQTNRHSLLHEPGQFNAWFTPEQVELAIANVSRQLERARLSAWMERYDEPKGKPANVGVVMAGNIPMVGFHDLMSVLLAGHNLLAKPSSQDSWLILHLINKLKSIEPRFANRILIKEQMKEVDAVIATGSDNTSRYFEYYFRKIPHLIRKNRSSCAVLTGSESQDELAALGLDIFSFYGLGCRNVSKIFIPSGKDIRDLLGLWQAFEHVVHHHKYANNYDYNKSILLVNCEPFLDNGFLLVRESRGIVSPISVLYYEAYGTDNPLEERLRESASKIQCIVGLPQEGLTTVPFGKAQFPELEDYADGVDVVKFLTDLRLN
jgi:hypothetical protein